MADRAARARTGEGHVTRPEISRLAAIAALMRDVRQAQAQQAAAARGVLDARLARIDAAGATGPDPAGFAAVAAYAVWHGQARGAVNTALARARLSEMQAARTAAEASARAMILERLALAGGRLPSR